MPQTGQAGQRKTTWEQADVAGTGEGMGWDWNHDYVQAGMGVDELVHQCRAQGEVPTAGMSMSNMLRPCGPDTSVENGRERNPRSDKGLG